MPTPKSPSLRNWVFTYQETVGNDLPDPDMIKDTFDKLEVQDALFQAEICPTTRRYHYQGVFRLKSKKTGPEIRKIFKSLCREFYADGCLTYAVCRDHSESMNYCTKEESRFPGTSPWYHPESFRTKYYRGQDLPDHEKLYAWQKEIVDIISGEPHDRDIITIVDQVGNRGKSVLVKYLAYHHNACVIPLGLSAAQVQSAIVRNGSRSIYLIDMPRNGAGQRMLFETVEMIKRGFIISSFQGTMKELFMLRPHIVMFSNTFPDLELMSFDMWRIKELRAVDDGLHDVNKFALLKIQQKRKEEKRLAEAKGG